VVIYNVSTGVFIVLPKFHRWVEEVVRPKDESAGVYRDQKNSRQGTF